MGDNDHPVDSWVAERTSRPPTAPATNPSLPAGLFEGIPNIGEEILGGKYKVDRVIGVGGMGAVVSAVHKQLGHRVAFKFLLPTMRTEEFTDRFLREGRAAAKIQSEHIARVIDADVLANGTPYLMMEYLQGADLADYLAEQGALPIEDAVDVVLQTLEALATAHNAGVVHRDLKPSNLFVARRPDGSSLVKVLDFGISKLSVLTEMESKMSLTRPGALLGSPMYMSPEQLRNAKDVDQRADIWAVGIVLHELLTGKPIFVADNFPALCAMIVGEPATPLREIIPDAPEELEHIILRCVEKDAADRWPSAAALAQELAPFASPEMAGLVARVLKMNRASLPGVTPDTLASASDPARKTPGLGRSPGGRTPSGRATPSTPSRKTPSSGRHTAPLDATEPATEKPSAGALGSLAVSTATPAPASRAKVMGVLAIGALIVGIGAFAIARHRTSDPHEQPASGASFAAPPPSAVVSRVEPDPPPPSALPSAAAAATPSAEPSTTAAKKPVTSTTAAKPRPAPAASSAPAAKPPSEGDLLQDRR